jgi:hypothetical protein
VSGLLLAGAQLTGLPGEGPLSYEGALLAGTQLTGLLGNGPLPCERVLLAGVTDFEGGSGYFVPLGHGHLVAGFADFFE